MRFSAITCAVIAAALLFPLSSTAAGTRAQSKVGLILHDRVPLRKAPSNHGKVMSVLIQQTQVEVLATKGTWDHVRLWASVKGWVPVKEVTFRKPWKTVSTYHAPQVKHTVSGHAPATLHASGIITWGAAVLSAPGGARAGAVGTGQRVSISAWQQDAAGGIWYRVPAGWVPGGSVRFTTPPPGETRVHGVPLWHGAAGKGMWLTLGPIATSDPAVVVRAALKNGISHLYLESAISPLGFHGRGSVGPLIEAAHAKGITVLAWVYPYLYDVGADIELTRQVAAFRTASGQRFDGIAADLENNMTAEKIRAYSQVVRAYLGNNYLLVGVTYPPQSLAAYPFADVAHSFNLIAPMDYWHQTSTDYGLDYGHMHYGSDYAERYARDSIAIIRRSAGSVPIAPIGQVFDDFGHFEMGPNAPSAAEIDGFLRGCKTGRAVGASFFQWMTATDAEWRSIQAFRF